MLIFITDEIYTRHFVTVSAFRLLFVAKSHVQILFESYFNASWFVSAPHDNDNAENNK